MRLPLRSRVPHVRPALRANVEFLTLIIPLLLLTPRLSAQTPPPAQQSAPPVTTAPAQKPDTQKPATPDPEQELQKAITDAGADYAKAVHNLKDYLQRFPNAPRKAAVYRAIVQSCQQIRDDACALDYAEKLVAIQPEDSQTTMTAVTLLQQRGDPPSLTLANTYVSNVIIGVQKLSPDERPQQMSLIDWQAQRDKLHMALLNLRGDIERAQTTDDIATKDYQSSMSLLPNPGAAKALGDIAYARHDYAAAANQYALALVLPDEGPGKADRTDLLARLKSAWQQAHGNEQGLGDAILAAYNHVPIPASAAANAPPKPNKDAKNVFDFVLRRLDQSPLPLAPMKGKIVVLSFWATWCSPCQILEPILADMSEKYAKNPNITFLGVNADEDETIVPRFLSRMRWDLPVAYSNGLKEFLGVDAFPTVIILDRDGKTIFRVAGFPETGYIDTLTAAIHSAAGPAIPSKPE